MERSRFTRLLLSTAAGANSAVQAGAQSIPPTSDALDTCEIDDYSTAMENRVEGDAVSSGSSAVAMLLRPSTVQVGAIALYGVVGTVLSPLFLPPHPVHTSVGVEVVRTVSGPFAVHSSAILDEFRQLDLYTGEAILATLIVVLAVLSALETWRGRHYKSARRAVAIGICMTIVVTCVACVSEGISAVLVVFLFISLVIFISGCVKDRRWTQSGVHDAT